jgi:hypothetical protein
VARFGIHPHQILRLENDVDECCGPASLEMIGGTNGSASPWFRPAKIGRGSAYEMSLEFRSWAGHSCESFAFEFELGVPDIDNQRLPKIHGSK